MRKEMRLFEKQFPSKKTILYRFKQVRNRIILQWFTYRLRFMELGSLEWHILQEKLSHGSAVGVDMMKRNAFYSKTLFNCGDNIHIMPNVIIYYPRNVKLGHGVFMNRGVFITAPERIEIGNRAGIGPYTVLNSGSHLYQDPSKPFLDQGHRLAPIIIEDDVWVGAHVTILPGVILGKGAVVAAGAVVTKSVDPYTVVAGIPARAIKKRTGGS